MIIQRRYKPWLMTSQGGDWDARPILHCVGVERIDETNGVAVAANGFIMGVFPVTLTPEEEVGLIHGDLMKYAHAKSTKELVRATRGETAIGTVALTIKGEMVEMPDGSLHPQTVKGNYPYWRGIVEPAVDKAQVGVATAVLGFTPALVIRLAKAFGWSDRDVVTMRFSEGAKGPVVIGQFWIGSRPELPYAILMPAHST